MTTLAHIFKFRKKSLEMLCILVGVEGVRGLGRVVRRCFFSYNFIYIQFSLFRIWLQVKELGFVMLKHFQIYLYLYRYKGISTTQTSKSWQAEKGVRVYSQTVVQSCHISTCLHSRLHFQGFTAAFKYGHHGLQ